jgi:hypothetical protein
MYNIEYCPRQAIPKGDTLIGDERTRRTFQGVIHGIVAGESLRAAVIARFSPCHGERGAWRTEG